MLNTLVYAYTCVTTYFAEVAYENLDERELAWINLSNEFNLFFNCS